MYVRFLRAAFSTHLIFLLLITLIIFVEQYELWNFTMCNVSRPPVASSQVGPNILHTTMQAYKSRGWQSCIILVRV